MVTPELLKAAGEALFGPHWLTPLSAAIAVHERTVRRWAAGQADIPDGIRAELAQLLRRRSAALAQLAERLERTA